MVQPPTCAGSWILLYELTLARYSRALTIPVKPNGCPRWGCSGLSTNGFSNLKTGKG